MQPLKYDEFIIQATQRGFVSKHIANFPPTNNYWWSGDPEADPTLWAMRASQEKKLVYGAFFKGQKGYISPEWYSIYYHAFHPTRTVEERYEAGLLKTEEWRVWQLLKSEARPLGTHEIRRQLGVSPKKGAAAVDAAITSLQMTCDIIITGEVDMLDKNGKPYNKAVAYTLRPLWLPDSRLHGDKCVSRAEAQEMIYKQVNGVSDHKDMEIVKGLFSKQLRLLKNMG